MVNKPLIRPYKGLISGGGTLGGGRLTSHDITVCPQTSSTRSIPAPRSEISCRQHTPQSAVSHVTLSTAASGGSGRCFQKNILNK